MKRVKLFHDAQAGIILALKESLGKYFISDKKSFSLSKGVQTVEIENILNGILQAEWFLAFFDEAFVGYYEEPFNF